MRRTRRIVVIGIAITCCLVLGATTHATPAASWHTDLPQIPRSGRDARIERYRQAYLQKARAGAFDRPSPAKRADEAHLAKLAADLNRDLLGHKFDRPVLIIIEGPDGAGKSSTIRRLKPAFAGVVPVSETHFGAPPANAEDVHWVKRYFDALPRKGTVVIWDRSYYGRAVYDRYYGMASKGLTRKTIDEIAHLEGLLAGKVDIVKIFLDVSGERQAKTIAKREVTAPEKLSASDYRTYRDRKEIARLFRRAIDGTSHAVPWHVVEMDERADGRADIFRIVRRALLE